MVVANAPWLFRSVIPWGDNRSAAPMMGYIRLSKSALPPATV